MPGHNTDEGVKRLKRKNVPIGGTMPKGKIVHIRVVFDETGLKRSLEVFYV